VAAQSWELETAADRTLGFFKVTVLPKIELLFRR